MRRPALQREVRLGQAAPGPVKRRPTNRQAGSKLVRARIVMNQTGSKWITRYEKMRIPKGSPARSGWVQPGQTESGQSSGWVKAGATKSNPPTAGVRLHFVIARQVGATSRIKAESKPIKVDQSSGISAKSRTPMWQAETAIAPGRRGRGGIQGISRLLFNL